MSPKRDNLVGQKFGRLTVVSFSHINRQGNSTWKVVCDCGKESLVAGGKLKGLTTKSCGCYKKEIITTHGSSNKKTYLVWDGMIQRCLNSNSKSFHKYGARGITVCSRWRKFENFLEDMGHGPSGFSIDRIDNNGNYEPCNCRWADCSTQAINQRTSKLNTSGVVGVTKRVGRYSVNIALFNKRFRVGGYETIEIAKEVRGMAEKIREDLLSEYREKIINIHKALGTPGFDKGAKPDRETLGVNHDADYRVSIVETFKSRILNLRQIATRSLAFDPDEYTIWKNPNEVWHSTHLTGNQL